MSRIVRALLVFAFLMTVAVQASAQSFNPYDPTDPRLTGQSWCQRWNPYTEPAPVCLPESDITALSATVLSIPEGVANIPGSDYAYLVLLPLEGGRQNIVVKYLVDGRAPIYRYQYLTIQDGGARMSFEAHREFSGPTTFSVVVYCEKRCGAQLVMRNAANFWQNPTIPPTQTVR
jgi:hypothetical protein